MEASVNQKTVLQVSHMNDKIDEQLSNEAEILLKIKDRLEKNNEKLDTILH